MRCVREWYVLTLRVSTYFIFNIIIRLIEKSCFENEEGFSIELIQIMWLCNLGEKKVFFCGNIVFEGRKILTQRGFIKKLSC